MTLMMIHRMITAWNLVTPRIPDTLKIFSNTSEPEYRITGICTTMYSRMYAMENHSFVLRS